jgi:hypothetical protein
VNSTSAGIEALLALVDAFHVTDRALLRARDRVRREGTAAADAEFRRQAERYFGSLEHEAGAHVTDIDRKLDDLYQRQYNLQAERGVAQRRLDAARGVLAALADDAGNGRIPR